MKSLLILTFLLISTLAYSRIFTISVKSDYYDASKAGVLAGDTICIEGGEREYLQIRNVLGDSSNRVLITSCGSEVLIRNEEFRHGLIIFNSRFFHLTGFSEQDSTSIKILGTGSGASGLSIGDMSTDFEVDHLEIANAGFAGIMTKTDPRCDSSVNRGNFFMRNILIHDNYIHDVGGEGIYAGNSFYGGWTANKECPGDTLYPHEISSIKIYRNLIMNTGWDGLQLGCAVEDAEITDNIIINFGLDSINAQNNGIQAGEGTTGIIARNIIEAGPGNGIVLLGLGNNLVFDNLIAGTGTGIFCDNRVTLDSSIVAIFNNTFIDPGNFAVLLYNEKTRNFLFNNVLAVKDSTTKFSSYFKNVYVVEQNNILESYTDEKELLSLNLGSSLPADSFIPSKLLPPVQLPVCGVNFLRKE